MPRRVRTTHDNVLPGDQVSDQPDPEYPASRLEADARARRDRGTNTFGYRRSPWKVAPTGTGVTQPHRCCHQSSSPDVAQLTSFTEPSPRLKDLGSNRNVPLMAEPPWRPGPGTAQTRHPAPVDDQAQVPPMFGAHLGAHERDTETSPTRAHRATKRTAIPTRLGMVT